MTITAHAAILREAGGCMTIEAVDIDDPRPDEVLIEIVATGVCHTDMVMRDGHLPVPRPVVLGHEGAGVVIAVGSAVSHVVPGDSVVLSFGSCGHCVSCDRDQPAYCHHFVERNFLAMREDGTTAISIDGSPVHSHVFGQSSFATHAIAPGRNVVKVPADLPLEIMGPLGCGFLTGAGAVLKALKVKAGSTIAISGTGAVGIAAVMAARIAGASTIIAIDRSPGRVALACSLGATHGFVADGRTVAEMAALAECSALDFVLDTTGHAGVVEQGIAALGPCGEIGLLAAFALDVNLLVNAAHVMSAGRVIRGIVEGSVDPQTFIPELIAYWREGRFPFDRLIEHFDFADIGAAFAAAESGLVVKPVLRMK